MKQWSVLLSLVMVVALLLACGQTAQAPTMIPPTTTDSLPELPPTTVPSVQTPSGKYLTPNPMETAKPVYGGTLSHAITGLRSLDAHQLVGYGPTATLPIFNQLVMFDLTYKETVPETIIGDLAESWENSADGKDITFHLRQGVKWQDDVPFTADDVIYSLEKMTDVNRSAIKDWFPAFDSVDKIDENTVIVHLKYASAGFMLALAQGESQIQPLHLSGADPQSLKFAVGTGPFILTEYVPGVDLKYKRNPNYWKKDIYGNQLPYMDGINLYIMGNTNTQDALIARRLDIKGTVTGNALIDTYNQLLQGAPELLWQRRDRYNGTTVYLNTQKPPLNDIKVRRAIGLVLKEDDIITGGTGDVRFGITDVGILHPSFGLPKEEVIKLMGWDRPYDERVTEAQKLMAEAGYADGFELQMLATSGLPADSTLVLVNALRTNLKIKANVVNLGTLEMFKRVDAGDFNTMTWDLTITDPAIGLSNYFTTTGYANYSKYSNPELDKILEGLDHILDPEKRREALQQVDRILLTDLPVLPTGLFQPNFMPYYPWVKNMRWNYISYSNVNRLEDVWIDPSLKK